MIYDVGPGYLVLEDIEGSTPNGPLSSDDTVRLGLQEDRNSLGTIK
jgi:hypothetical protein